MDPSAQDLALPLPADIPWRRRCATDNMIDVGRCGRDLPPRWQPSIAIFEYEPPVEQQVHDDLTVSYLKVTCSITGHTLSELSDMGSSGSYFYDASVEEFVLHGDEQDACYGALVHVTVQPLDRDTSLDQYPYIADFQPKKRELLELVTQTGSTLSRSLDEVQVRKGGTTATNSEVLDSDKQIDWTSLGAAGGSVAGGAIAGPAGAVVGGVVGSGLGEFLGGGDSGKSVNQASTENLLTTDRSLEKREEYSHTTQLAQMYQQLTSYHLGTNRALFYVLPRPHIVQTLRTFVNGPHQLEGIQEFMLTVVRPRSMHHLCVNVMMELAHVRFERGVIKGREPWGFYDDENSFPRPPFLGLIKNPMPSAPDWTASELPFEPKPGWEFDLSTNSNGYEVVSKPANVTVDVVIDEATQKAKIKLTIPASSATFLKDVTPGLPVLSGILGTYQAHYAPTNVELSFLVRLKSEEGQQVTDIPMHLDTRAHHLCCCPDADERLTPAVGIVYEGSFSGPVGAIPGTLMPIEAANQLTADIGDALVRSMSSPDRHPYGDVAPIESQFLAEGIARRIGAVGHPDNTPAADMAGLRDDIRERILGTGSVHRADMLRMSVGETRDRFGLSLEEARHLRRAALRLEEPALAPEERWLPRAIRDVRAVPDLVGLPAALARQLLRASGLKVGAITVSDDAQPTSAVLAQDPAAGEMVRGDTRVSLTVSAELSIRLPNLVGHPLAEAVCELKDAGVESEPTLRFRRARKDARFVVIASEPLAGELIASRTEIVLHLEPEK